MKKEAITHGVLEDLANRNDNWDKLDGVPEKVDLLMESKAEWQAVSDEMTNKDVISAPEIIAARNGEADLKARLDKEHQEVTTQLAQKAKSKLFKKKWNVLGDSITFGGSPGVTKTYHQVIKDNYGLTKVNNYGINGTEISAGGTFSSPFINRYLTMEKDVDYITVLGGVNDFLHNVPLGTEDSTDNNTFYGALNNLCVGLFINFTNSYIGFITPTRVADNRSEAPGGINALGLKLEDYANAIIEVCNKQNMPVLDLYHGGGFRPDITEFRNIYMPDGLHPIDVGHEKLAHIISSFLESLSSGNVGNVGISSLNKEITRILANVYKKSDPLDKSMVAYSTSSDFSLLDGSLTLNSADALAFQDVMFSSAVDSFEFKRVTTNPIGSQMWVVIGGSSNDLIMIQINNSAIGNVVSRLVNKTTGTAIIGKPKLSGSFSHIKVTKSATEIKIDVLDTGLKKSVSYPISSFTAEEQSMILNGGFGFIIQKEYATGITIFTNGKVPNQKISEIEKRIAALESLVNPQ